MLRLSIFAFVVAVLPAMADEAGYITGEWDNGNPIVSLHPKIVGQPSTEYRRGFCDGVKLIAFKNNPIPKWWRIKITDGVECR